MTEDDGVRGNEPPGASSQRSTRRRIRLAIRVPFLAWERTDDDRDASTRTRFTVRLPGVSWEVDATDVLDAAGKRSRQTRQAESQLAGWSAIVGFATAVVGVVASLITTDTALGGASASLIAVLVAAGVLTAATTTAFLLGREREQAADPVPPPTNVADFARQLAQARRTALERLQAHSIDE